MPFVKHKSCSLYKNLLRENVHRIESCRFGSTHTISKITLGAEKIEEENAALSILEYKVLKPSDFLHRGLTNYIFVTVAKGLMLLGERVISHGFPITVDKKLSVKIAIANVVKDTTDTLLLDDLFVRKRKWSLRY